MTRYVPLLLTIFGLIGLGALPASSQDHCDRSPWVEQIYQQEVALYESCGASASCLEKRSENIETALAEAPDDVTLHRIYQFVKKSHGRDAEKSLIEEYRRRSETRRTGPNLYLYARLLGDKAKRLALFEEAVQLEASLPWPHRALMILYAQSGDLESTGQSLQQFLTLCPASIGVHNRFSDLFPSASFWRPHLKAAGRYLRSVAFENHYHRLSDLWSAELELDPTNHRLHHQAIKKDLAAIADLDLEDRSEDEAIRWWRIQHNGYSLLGDKVGMKRALEKRAELEPCHQEVVNGRIAIWEDELPMNSVPTAENIAARNRSQREASDMWLESCPMSFRYWGMNLAAGAADADLADRELLRRVKKARREVQMFGPGLTELDREAFAITLSRALHERSLTIETGEDWLSTEWVNLGAFKDGELDLAALFPAELEELLADTAVGKKLRPFELADLDGRVRSSEELRGKIVFVDIWSSSCLPCRQAMPKIQALHELTANDESFEVLTISADAVQRHAISLIRGSDYSFPVVIDGDYALEMGVAIYPTQWLVGGDLEIVKDLTLAMIPYDDAWPEKVFDLMQKEAVHLSPSNGIR